MFTFVSVGQIFKRKTPIFNTLTASACFILIFNPFLIKEIGFQLSYLAVAGIVVTQPGIYQLLNFKNKIADKTWGMICVSIASQIATFPITLYYFHQFPVYFLISNLLVIPISYIIMMLGVAFLVIMPFKLCRFLCW
jgi:competence protein ComEC